MVLVLGAMDRAPAYLQFAIVIMFSAILLFYIAKEEPYVQRRLNMYVFTMELIYFLLGMAIFVFTDASDELKLKTVAAFACIVLVIFFTAVTFFMSFYFAVKGKASLRASDKLRKM